MKKNRVTLLLDDIPYKLLRVMAATENKSMSQIVDEFLHGDRRNVTDEEEIKQLEDEHDIEPDEENEEEFKFNDDGTITDGKGNVLKEHDEV